MDSTAYQRVKNASRLPCQILFVRISGVDTTRRGRAAKSQSRKIATLVLTIKCSRVCVGCRFTKHVIRANRLILVVRPYTQYFFFHKVSPKMKTNEHSIILIDPAPHTGGPVEIDFDDCDTEAKIVGWIQHLCPKIWVTKEQIQYFISAALTHHNITLPD